MNRLHVVVVAVVVSASLSQPVSVSSAQDASFDPKRFEPTVLATGLQRPMELEVAADGTIFFIELEGQIKALDPVTRAVRDVGQVKVTTEQENGLIGFALDPDFSTNQWVYLQYSPPDLPGQQISRFTLVDGQLDQRLTVPPTIRLALNE